MLRERLVVRFFAVSGRRLLYWIKSRRKVFNLLEKSLVRIPGIGGASWIICPYSSCTKRNFMSSHISLRCHLQKVSKFENDFAERHYISRKEPGKFM